MDIDLTRAQKIQITLAALVLAGAGYFVYRSMQPAPDLTVASWVERQVLPKNPALPLSASNPLDRAHPLTVTVFACYDGRLTITESPSDPAAKAQFDFTPDTRRKNFETFQDMLVTIRAMNDSYKRAMSYTAYRVVNGLPGIGLLNVAGLNTEQRKTELEARHTMMDAVAVMESSAASGIFKPEAYKNVMAALTAYKAVPGDPSKDPAKAAAAHKVVNMAVEYIGLMQKEKTAAINRYIAAVDNMLTSEQRVKVQKAAARVTIPARQPVVKRAKLAAI